jgi:hypothetical protein
MKTTAYISLLYGLIIILSGIMAYRFENNTISLYIEIPIGIIIIGNVFFMMKSKKLSFYLLLGLSLLLTIFYGYYFSKTYQFFNGLLAGISFFVFIYEFLKVFKIFGAE